MTNHAFSENDTTEFLRSGFIFGLSDRRLVIGWGELKKSQGPSLNPDSPCSVYAPDFYLEDKTPWMIPSKFALVTREFFATHVLPKMTTEVKDFRWDEPSETGFKTQFEKIQKAFNNEGLQKAVPVVHATADAVPKPELVSELLRCLSQIPQSLTAYGFWDFRSNQPEGVLGATPETLFLQKGRELSTMALAGTRAKASNGSGAEALLADPKERREHQLVIDDIQRVLSKFGVVDVGPTTAAELPTLFHLKTPISVQLSSDTSFETLTEALHPTPALGLAPRALGLNFLKNWDDVQLRGRFGAPFGILVKTEDGLHQECLVGIRNISWRGSRFQLGSGCGIVPESQVDREWAELKLKRDSVKKIFRLNSGGTLAHLGSEEA